MIGSDIAEARKARGWSQEELGDRAGVSQSVVSYAERGKTTVAIYLVNCVRQAVGLVPLPDVPRPPDLERPSRRHLQGFGSMSQEERKRLASIGGKACQAKGAAKRWTEKEAKAARKKQLDSRASCAQSAGPANQARPAAVGR